MWCENCGISTASGETRVRITKDGNEVVRYRCSICFYVTEIEYDKPGSTTRIHNQDE